MKYKSFIAKGHPVFLLYCEISRHLIHSFLVSSVWITRFCETAIHLARNSVA